MTTWFWRGARPWAIPSTILLVAAVGAGVWTRTADAGPFARAVLQAADARCPEAIESEHRPPRIGDAIAAADHWARLRIREKVDGRDRCASPTAFYARLTRGVRRIGMVRRATVLP